MKNKLVKIICAAVCFAIAVGIFTPAAIELGKKNIERAALKTALATAQMCRENKADYEEQLANSDETIMAIPTRLVVETKKRIKNLPEGTEVIYKDDTACIQCESESLAESLKKRLTDEGYAVDNDYLAKVIAIEESEPSYSHPDNWGYERIESADAMAKLTDTQKSKQINVMVVDTGVNYSLLKIKDRIIDHSVNLSTSGSEGDAKDDNGHGTCVSSVIIKTTPDNVKIIAVKLINSNGQFYMTEFEDTLDYLRKLTTKPDVMNMSLTFPTANIGPKAFARIDKKCAELVDNGTVCVAAAGNESANLAPTYHPAACAKFLTVAASNYGNDRADFSNYNITGDHTIDIAAPGKQINMIGKDSSYIEVKGDGTSFASPMVAAAAAIVLMQHPEMTSAQVGTRLCERAMPFKVHKNYGDRAQEWTCCRWGGYGILNMYNLIDGDRVANVNYDILSSKLDCSDMQISLSCPQAGATIYYTTDGTRPTTKSKVYTGPISITEFTRVFAVAYYGNLLHSYYTVAEVGPYVMPENDSDYLQIDSRGYITGYTGKRTSFIIDKPDNKTINGIAAGAFENSKVKYLELSASCKDIEANAFSGSAIESIKSVNTTALDYNNEGQRNLITDPKSYIDSVNGTFGVERVGESAFAECRYLTSADFPNLLIAEESAFKNCTSLSNFTAKYSTVIGDYAYMNTAIKSVSFPYCTDVPNYAFYGCGRIETINLPMAKTVGEGAFGCEELTDINISNVEQFTGKNNFYNCINLNSLDLPNSQNLPSFGFSSYNTNNQMKYIYAPKATDFSSGTSNLYPIKMLDYIYAPYLNSIGTGVRLPATTIYTTSSLTYASTGHNAKLKVVGYEDTYAKTWAEGAGYSFCSIDEHRLNFDSLTSDYCTYSCSQCDDVIAFPRYVMDKQYSFDIMNQKISKASYISMFDLVPDGYINAKDYAQYRRLTKNQ